MTRFDATKTVYRHASDNQSTDCGRACAQMIISSLKFGASTGGIPTPAQAARPVPVQQDFLKWQEADNVDSAGKWYTFPDELLVMLKTDPDLIANNLIDWRIANCRTKSELWAWIRASLMRGMPAVLNIRVNDHWVCVRSVTDNSGALSLVEFLDPLLPAPRYGPAPNAHTYLDACATDGIHWWDIVIEPPNVLGAWQLAVGSTPPTTYQGRYVAIVYGPKPSKPPAPGKKKKQQEQQQSQIKEASSPTPEGRVRELLEQLARVGDIQPVADILQGSHVISVRTVHDISGAEKPYVIAAMFAEAPGRGLVAIFDEGIHHFLHLRLTSNVNLTDSIAQSSANAPLWWTRNGLSTLFSPYFPFDQYTDHGQTKFRRLIDRQVLVPGNPERA